VDERPTLANAPVASLGVCVLRFQQESGIDGEVKQGFVLKANSDRVEITGSEDFGVVNGLALHLFKAMKLAAIIAADSGLAALDDFGRRQAWKGSSFFGFRFG